MTAAPLANAPGLPGNRGIRVGIYCAMAGFALMFLVYFLARATIPELSTTARPCSGWSPANSPCAGRS